MTKTIRLDLCLFYAIAAMACISPFVFVKGLFDYALLPQSVFIQILGCFSLGAFVIFTNKIRVLKNSLNLAILAFLAWCFVSVLYAHNSFEGTQVFTHWAACALVFFALQQIDITPQMTKRLLIGLYIAGVGISLIGICQALFGFSLIPQSAPPSATMANCNMAAQFITLTWPLGLLIKKRHAVIGCAAMLLFLYLTQTKAAWLAVGIETVIIGCVLGARHLKSHKIILLIVFLLMSGIVFFKTTSPVSINSRISMSKNTIEMIKDNPMLGVGLGNFNVFYPKYQKYNFAGNYNEQIQVVQAHNDPLQIIAETGIIGGLLALAVIFLFFKMIINRLAGDKDTGYFIALAIGVATFGILINSCFSFPSRLSIPPLVVMIYFAIAMSNSKPVEAPKKLTYAAIAGLVITLGCIVNYQFGNLVQSKYIMYTKAFEQQKNWKVVHFLAEKGREANPHRIKMLSYSGRALIQLGHFQKGVDNLEAVTRAYPYHMNALLNLGVGYSGLGQDEKSIECYERVLEIKPGHNRAYLNMAVSYAKLKQNDKAIAAFEKAKG